MLSIDQINKQVKADTAASDNRLLEALKSTCTPGVTVYRYIYQPGEEPRLEQVVAGMSHFYTIIKTNDEGVEEELRLPERVQMINCTLADYEVKQLITHIIGHNKIVKAAINPSYARLQRQASVKTLQADLESKTMGYSYPYSAQYAYRSPLTLVIGDKVAIDAQELADEWLDYKTTALVKRHKWLKAHPKEAAIIEQEQEEARRLKEAEEQAIFDEAMTAARVKIYGN